MTSQPQGMPPPQPHITSHHITLRCVLLLSYPSIHRVYHSMMSGITILHRRKSHSFCFTRCEAPNWKHCSLLVDNTNWSVNFPFRHSPAGCQCFRLTANFQPNLHHCYHFTWWVYRCLIQADTEIKTLLRWSIILLYLLQKGADTVLLSQPYPTAGEILSLTYGWPCLLSCETVEQSYSKNSSMPTSFLCFLNEHVSTTNWPFMVF